MADYDKLLRQYIESGRLHTNGLPTAKYCADKLYLSEACFCDVLLHKTGLAHDCYCQTKRIEMVKSKLTGSNTPLHLNVDDFHPICFYALTRPCSARIATLPTLRQNTYVSSEQTTYFQLMYYAPWKTTWLLGKRNSVIKKACDEKRKYGVQSFILLATHFNFLF